MKCDVLVIKETLYYAVTLKQNLALACFCENVTFSENCNTWPPVSPKLYREYRSLAYIGRSTGQFSFQRFDSFFSVIFQILTFVFSMVGIGA